MAKFSISTHIAAPPEVVFPLLCDLEHTAENISGIDRLEVLTDGPIGVGTRFCETRTMFGKQATEEMEFTAFDEPHGYTVECNSCGAHYVATYELIPDIWGTTVKLDFDCQAMTLLAKAISPLSLFMMGPMKKCIAADLEDIKRVAEAQEWQLA
ncbi:SRPBCC family protein [Bythopirellula polymerisocia]|uniref:Polyketide cyclase / dehydrase and lipid transport n=1 Tax=Bythopirellula polymerisocia TaxID=2528003 RepID=A0A5C6C7H6_9BACT|nr:SRPBCC family protein [Bythopirellula polymerisocia]TWU20055.1 Polyketide cyclase / dehydrase and lipid transport [Bythopirellula polymerisocia]